MFNSVNLVGRLAREFNITENENGKKYVSSSLAITNDYKNSNGEYDTEFIPFTLFGLTAERAAEYCKVGDVIGIRGHLSYSNNKLFINTDKLSFVASKSKKDEPEVEKDIKM